MSKYKMAGKFMRRRRVVRKRLPKYKGYRSMRRNPLRKFYQGGFTIQRKLPVISYKSANVVGLVTKSDPTGSFLNLGTPVATTIAGLWDIPFSMSFQLNQISQVTDITNIADKYRINWAKVKINNAFQLSNATGAIPPTIEWENDHDDAAVPDVVAFRARMGIHTKSFTPNTNSIYMKVAPKVSRQIYSSLLPAYEVPRGRVFVDTENVTVPHYGIKGVIRNAFLNGTADQGLMTFDVTMSVTCKDLQ